MINCGFIFLIDKDGVAVTGAKYDYPGARKVIQKQWKMLYSAAYKNCYIQISPITDPKLVNPDGTNRKFYKQRKNK